MSRCSIGSDRSVDRTQRNACGTLGRREDAFEVERVGGDHRDWRARTLAAEAAEEGYGFGQGELFARETGDETAAADFAAEFHSPIRTPERRPSDGNPLAIQRSTENDACAA